jgi:hypothetical protein
MSAQQQTNFELDALTRTRLMLAGQIAAGLVSDGNQRRCSNWEGESARAALLVADKLIRLVVSGGL